MFWKNMPRKEWKALCKQPETARCSFVTISNRLSFFLLFRSILSECFRYTFSIKRKTDFTSILLTFGKLPASHRCVFYTGPHLLLKRSDSQTRGLTVCQISLKLYKALLITPFHICMKVILISPCKSKIFLLTYHFSLYYMGFTLFILVFGKYSL